MTDQKRRLAAILSADVVGYSRLMGDDEEATIEVLVDCRDVFSKRVENHDGRVVDTAGDSVLSVFDSVVEAVRCAMEIQIALSERNEKLSEDRRMRFRIGINLGDIIEKEDGTVYGDGVNVAARMEALAEPGGVTLSDDAYRQVRTKLEVTFEDMGDQEVKNIAERIRAFRLVDSHRPRAAPVSQAPSALPDKPSIAVLPFANMSSDPENEFFSDGITEEIINALAQVDALHVASRVPHVFVLLQGQDTGDARDRGAAASDNTVGGECTQSRQPRSDYGPAHRRRQRRASLVRTVRPRNRRHLCDSGRNRTSYRGQVEGIPRRWSRHATRKTAHGESRGVSVIPQRALPAVQTRPGDSPRIGMLQTGGCPRS